MTQKSMSCSNVAIGTAPRNFYWIHFWDMIKSEVNRIKNVDLSEKSGQL